MRTPEEIALEWGLCNCDEAYTKRGIADPYCPLHSFAVEEAIGQAQQEAYEEGRRDGYAACKSDYATQITYNK